MSMPVVCLDRRLSSSGLNLFSDPFLSGNLWISFSNFFSLLMQPHTGGFLVSLQRLLSWSDTVSLARPVLQLLSSWTEKILNSVALKCADHH